MAGAYIARPLLEWFRSARRDLPWRRTRDPYAIWVSETMLQQTTVATVSSRYPRFLARFPSIAHLAAAPEADVLHEWSGLGYYARARNLHKAARQVVDRFAGELPRTAAELRTLPGIGSYTASAIASIAFGEPVALLDVNVVRVLARLTADGTPIKSAASLRRFGELAAQLLDRDSPGDFNEAMMELGATVCTPKAPQCPDCPIRRACRGAAGGNPARYPVVPPKPEFRSVIRHGVVMWRGQRLLVLQCGRTSGFSGMWELPMHPPLDPGVGIDSVSYTATVCTGITISGARELATIRHTIMRTRITLHVHEADAGPEELSLPFHEEGRWVTPEEWSAMPKSSAQARICNLLLKRGR